ncbi:MAG: zinc ribbon domain-containing protein [Desulfobacterales bacterium]|nr:zinc ribbon domain-containing protein [Desulfobacterales bacterium]
MNDKIAMNLMTMFLIAGISPKIKQLDSNPQQCSVCGQTRAYTRRVDHYLSLFFIPVLRVKKGETFVMCNACAQQTHGSAGESDRGRETTADRCQSCGGRLATNFKYCPHCGKKT